MWDAAKAAWNFINNYPNKFSNLVEIEEVLERYKLPKVTQEERENLNSPIKRFVADNLPTIKSTGQTAQVNSTIYGRHSNNCTPTLLGINIFQLILRVNITYIPKPDKDITRKENHRSITL